MRKRKKLICMQCKKILAQEPSGFLPKKALYTNTKTLTCTFVIVVAITIYLTFAQMLIISRKSLLHFLSQRLCLSGDKWHDRGE